MFATVGAGCRCIHRVSIWLTLYTCDDSWAQYLACNSLILRNQNQKRNWLSVCFIRAQRSIGWGREFACPMLEMQETYMFARHCVRGLLLLCLGISVVGCSTSGLDSIQVTPATQSVAVGQ